MVEWNSGADVDWTYNVQTGTVKMSDGLETAFGWSPATVKPRRWWIDRLHPEDRERVVVKTDDMLRGAEKACGLSYRFRHKSGMYVRVLDRWSVERDGDGRATRVTGRMVNLSMRGAAQAEARLRLALAAGKVGTWDWDLVTNEWSLDGRGRTIIGLAEPSTEGFLQVVHPDDREQVAAHLEEIRSEAVTDYEDSFRINRQPDGQRWVLVNGKVLNDGTDRRLLGTIVDITERRAFETRILAAENARRIDAEEANKAKAEFLAAMSHELRTPLNAIAGYTELLELGVHGGLTDLQLEDLRRIRHASQHLLGLISDILDFTRIEAKRIDLKIRDVALDAVLTEAFAMIEPQARTKGVTATYMGPPLSCTAKADAERVRQIVLNLLSNAVKFTRAGGCVVLACEVITGGGMKVTVRDTGRGIPPDKLDAIFEPFVQVGRQLAPGEHAGVGLGLAISRELARRMSGDLTVESVHGEGSTFTLTLPAGGDA
ncbi:MAG TPA: ATP-binding protein [Gemmatimonadaceae bacterium]|nr:ATP-binding protein [Gemmatimonadaceae bacterium]